MDNKISELVNKITDEPQTEPVQPERPTIVLGNMTMDRISQMLTQDATIGTVLTAAIEASGHDPNAKWQLHLRGALIKVE